MAYQPLLAWIVNSCIPYARLGKFISFWLPHCFDGKLFSVCNGFASLLGNYVMDCLENSSILHVLLLVYLRFYIIQNPMTKVGPIRHRKVLLIVTWMIPIITKLPIFFIRDDFHYHELLIYMTIQFLIFFGTLCSLDYCFIRKNEKLDCHVN